MRHPADGLRNMYVRGPGLRHCASLVPEVHDDLRQARAKITTGNLTRA